ncbi:hypothetical protein B0H66DRAFT_594073 [Apodospora peruviana]|uniref:Uncharacterized protein n=1 Tax=Apodospora peruviana TaxID=516989 RepID=A0AAE0M189_9PEZI|nr:hypothetical protein B0H66DRAFT_594073 [Apodospora peruviana]
MEWPTVIDPFLTITDDDYFFNYNQGDKFACKVLRRQGNVNGTMELVSEEEWSKWREGLESTADLTQIPPDDIDRSGYHVLLSARAKPLTQTVEPALNALPFSLEDWKLVTQFFYLHNAVCDPMLGNFLSTMTTHLVKDHGNETLDMFTAVMSSENFPDNIAVSSTYFRRPRVTVAVVYGCNESQMEEAQKLLEGSPEVKSHPLLMIGIFEELQRNRMQNFLEELTAEFEEIIDKLDLRTFEEAKTSKKRRRLNIDNARLRNCRVQSRKLEEEVRVAKCQVEKMLEQITKLEDEVAPPVTTQVDAQQQLPADQTPSRQAAAVQAHHVRWPGNELAADTERYKQRFKEICLHYEGMMAKCRMMSDELAFTRELYMAEMSRLESEAGLHEAQASRHQAKASTVLAFVAMLYLPMTSVATIFAMPVFDWKLRWLDIRFQKTAADADSPRSNLTAGPLGSTDPGSDVVFGAYGWLWVIISVILTAATIYGWRYYTQEREDDDNHDQDSDHFGTVRRAITMVHSGVGKGGGGGGGGGGGSGGAMVYTSNSSASRPSSSTPGVKEK